jgi:hypothetical protein
MFCDCVREQLGRPVDLDELLGRQVLDPLATALPVVSLAALVATDSPEDGGLGPAAREVAGRFTARGGFRAD